MMNNIKIIIATAVVAFICSCSKEQIDNTPSPVVLDDNFALDATLESTSPDNGLKTTIGTIGDKNYAVWSESDKIDVYDAAGNKITMSIAKYNGTYARFKIEETYGQEGEFTPLYAVYPAGVGTLSGKVLTFNTSDTQTYRDGSFDDGCNVAVGTVQEIKGVYSIWFKNVFSYIRLNLKAVTDITINTLELVANNGGKLSGDFSVSDITVEKPEAVATGTPGNDRIILDCKCQGDNGLKLEKGETGHFVFVVPCGSFASANDDAQRGFTLITNTKEPNFIVEQIVTTASNTYERSHLVNFPEKNLVCCYPIDYIKSPDPKEYKGTYYGRPIIWTPAKTMLNMSAELTAKATFTGKATNAPWILFDLNGGSTSVWVGVKAESSTWYIRNASSTSVSATEECKITITKRNSSNMKFNVVGLYSGSSGEGTATTNPTNEITSLCFFGQSDGYWGGGYYLYGATIYDITDADNKICVGNLVPVRRVTSETETVEKMECGLYDKVQHKFLGGLTTGQNKDPFTGPE